MIIQIDQDGFVQNKQLLDLVNLSPGLVNTYAAIHEAGTNSIYLAGRYFPPPGNVQAYVGKVNIFNPSNVVTIQDAAFSSSGNTITTELALKQGSGSEVLMLPVIEDCNNCLWSSENKGRGRVYRLNKNTLNSTYSVGVGKVNAFDMKMGITATADGGYAIVSSKGKYDQSGTLIELTATSPEVDPYLPLDGCTNGQYRFGYWDTDAFVVKFDGNDNIEWQRTFDSHHNPRQAYPGGS